MERVFEIKESALNVLWEALEDAHNRITLDVLKVYIKNGLKEIKEEDEDAGS